MTRPKTQIRQSPEQIETARAALAVTLAALALITGIAAAQTDSQSEPELVISSVTVEPSEPTAETLCSLRVELDNRSEQIASQLEFKVKINDTELPVYGNQVFMVPASASGSTEVKLYNFWSTETSRPMPKDGRLNVEVTLVAARWMKIGVEDGVETWEPLESVPGLPASNKISVELKE
jgi:hypothetical protein